MKKTKNYLADLNCSCGNKIKFMQDCFSVPVPKKQVLFTAIESGIVTTEKYICNDCALVTKQQENDKKFFQLDIFSGGVK